MSFLGFSNFYHRFIYGYSEITVPLMRLTWKDVPWVFSNDCRESFEKLKKAFITALVLTHWILDTPIMVETDASDYTLAAVFSIQTLDGDYHLVAFHSWTFKDAETNYDVHDKELTATYNAFKHWRHYLEGAGTSIDIVTDHRNLQYFSTTKSPLPLASPVFGVPLTVQHGNPFPRREAQYQAQHTHTPLECFPKTGE